jgi:AcrR family transcriptional regulator
MLTKERLPEERIDPRTKRTRELLLKSFRELLAEKSFEAITVQDVTDRATVNRATFYSHFEDKYDLLEQAFAEMFKQALHKNLPPESEFSSTNLQLLIQTICEFLAELHSHCAPSGRAQFDSLLEQQVKRQLYQVLLAWLKPALNGANLHNAAELRATVASWAIYGASLWWSQGTRQESAAAFARQAFPFINAGLEVETHNAPRQKVLAKAKFAKAHPERI